MKLLIFAMTMLATVSAMAATKPKQCSVGLTNGIEFRFAKLAGQQVFSPLDGPLQDMVIGVSIVKMPGSDVSPVSLNKSRSFARPTIACF